MRHAVWIEPRRTKRRIDDRHKPLVPKSGTTAMIITASVIFPDDSSYSSFLMRNYSVTVTTCALCLLG